MQIAKIKDNKVEEIGEHRQLFPNVAFPESGPPADWMAENSVLPVFLNRSYDPLKEKSVSVDPYIEDNIVWLHKIETMSDSEKAAVQTAETERVAELQRQERNRRLAETDWMASSDVTMSDEWKTYRQALRDITNHENWPNLSEPDIDGKGSDDWPTQPS